jgi:protoporphyrinogen oxidase
MLGYPGSSFDNFFEKLAGRIKAENGQIHLSSPVDRILTDDGRATGLAYRTPAGGTREERFDAVLATVPSFAFPKMVDLPGEYRHRVEAVHYMAAIVVILEMSRPLTKTYWMNITDDSVPFLGLIEHTNLMPKELYGGNYVLYLTNYLDREDDMYAMLQEDLVALYVKHLHKFNPDFDESWIKAVHYNALSAAQPIAEPGYSERIPSHVTPVAGLYLANTTQIYPEDRGTNYSVRMGREVASLMLSNLA